jgi:hypothetical protein
MRNTRATLRPELSLFVGIISFGERVVESTCICNIACIEAWLARFCGKKALKKKPETTLVPHRTSNLRPARES